MIKKLDLKIIKTLVSYIKLPKGYLNKISHFNNLMGEQENTVGKKWAYFGEFLEREPGYTTEKAIVYCYVCPFLTPVDINDYQVKDFAKVLQEFPEANCYTKLALAYLLEDAAVFDDIDIVAEDFCFLREIINTLHQYDKANYETLMQNLIKNSKPNWFDVGSMRSGEVSDLIWSINCSYEFLGTKLAKAFAKLESGKAPESTLNTLVKGLNISYLDAMCLNFFCLERAGSDRAVTNSIMNTLKELFKSDEVWTNIQKAAFDKIVSYKILPNRVFGNDELKDAMRYQDLYPQKIKFENLIYALNNDDFDNLVTFFSVDLFKLPTDKVDILLKTKYILRKSTFVYLITENMNRYMKEPEKIDTLSKLYENRYESIYNLLSSDYSMFCSFIAYEYVDLIKNIDRLDAYNLKRYLSNNFNANVLKVFKYWFNNGQYKRIIEVVQEKQLISSMDAKVYLGCDKESNREYIDIIANVLAMSEKNTYFAYFVYNILRTKEDSLKYFSEEELHSMYSSMKNILATFPEPRYWGTLSSSSIRTLDNLYMSEEDKERRKQEEEEAKRKEQLAAFHKYLDEQLERAGDKFDKFNAYWGYHIPKFGDKLEYGSLILEKFFPEPEIVMLNRKSVSNFMEGLGEMYRNELFTLQTLKGMVARITIEEEGGNTNE